MAAISQRKCSGGRIFVIITEIITKLVVPRNYFVIISARMVVENLKFYFQCWASLHMVLSEFRAVHVVHIFIYSFSLKSSLPRAAKGVGHSLRAAGARTIAIANGVIMLL